jgi:hypothetical protein
MNQAQAGEVWMTDIGSIVFITGGTTKMMIYYDYINGIMRSDPIENHLTTKVEMNLTEWLEYIVNLDAQHNSAFRKKPR